MYAIPFTTSSGLQISWVKVLTAGMMPFSNPRMNLCDRYVRVLIIETMFDHTVSVYFARTLGWPPSSVTRAKLVARKHDRSHVLR